MRFSLNEDFVPQSTNRSTQMTYTLTSIYLSHTNRYKESTIPGEKIPINIPRLLIIGETGVGKSTLCNTLSGVRYKKVAKRMSARNKRLRRITTATSVQIDDECKVEPIFKAKQGQESVTQNTEWKEINYLGNDKQKLIVIDTPGLNDANAEKTKKHRKDLRDRLESMGEVDLVLILLNKSCLGGGGGRLTKSINDMIDEIITIFGGNENLYDHLAVAFSCCDDGDEGWSQDLDENMDAWQTTLQKKFLGANIIPQNDDEQKNETANGYENEIAMFFLSSVQSDHTDKEGKEWSCQEDFEEIYKLCVQSHKNPLKAVDCESLSKLSDAVACIQKVRFYILMFDWSMCNINKHLYLFYL